jgi:hypothetical protein
MAHKEQHKVAAIIRQYAEKVAAEKAVAGGAPDRLTAADGQGGITTHKGAFPADPGEADLKSEQPNDGKVRTVASVPAGGPDRLTVADGQGGIYASGGTVPVDPGEAELKIDQPVDGISKRATNLRAALCKANPAIAARLGKQAGSAPSGPVVSDRPVEQANANVDIDLSTSTLAKIASAVLSTDAGVRFVHNTLEKQAGEQAARVQIQEAIAASQSFDYTEQVKSAAFDDIQEKAAAIYDALELNGVTEAHADLIIKQAAYHQERLNSLDHPLLKQAYAQGMDDAALMAAAEEAAGEEGVPPVEEVMPMGGEDLSEEEIMELLQEMIASGEITEEDIMEAVAATEGGMEQPMMEDEELVPA